LLYVSLSYKDKKENANQIGLYKFNPQEFAVNEILLVVSDYNICTRATFPIFYVISAFSFLYSKMGLESQCSDVKICHATWISTSSESWMNRNWCRALQNIHAV